MQINVLEYLENAVREYPDRVAYEDESGTMAFSQVAELAARVGTALCAYVEPRQPVLVLFEKSIFTPSLFLGVAQAGCFYAPLSADLPVMRLKTIIEASEADVLLADASHKELARSLGFGGTIITFEEASQTAAAPALLARRRAFSQDTDPLYVIFTSGSSGRPKGVLTPHRALIESIDTYATAFGITFKTVLGNQAPFDYIAAIRDIYLPLCTGAKTVIIPKTLFSTPQKLFAYVKKHEINTLSWAAAALALCVDLGAFETADRLENIRDVIFSGSVMSCKQLRVWQQNLPGTRFINHYGPTETTRSSTYYVVDKLVDENDVLPIGAPFPNTGILLLDENNQAVPPGEMGEICIKGSCLASGYYRNPEKTQEVFVQNPLQRDFSEVIYKTGDLGILQPDGNYTFHGRKDSQIKHMGHRVELGDIEASARALPGLQNCCCLYKAEKELVYIFYTGQVENKEVAVFLREQLPGHMVPRRFVKLDAMPVTFNGKTDMEALKRMM